MTLENRLIHLARCRFLESVPSIISPQVLGGAGGGGGCMSKAWTERFKASEVTAQRTGRCVKMWTTATQSKEQPRAGRGSRGRKKDGRSDPSPPLPPQVLASWCFTPHKTGAHCVYHGHSPRCRGRAQSAPLPAVVLICANEVRDRVSKRKDYITTYSTGQRSFRSRHFIYASSWWMLGCYRKKSSFFVKFLI